jgi:hypothetical protein
VKKKDTSALMMTFSQNTVRGGSRIPPPHPKGGRAPIKVKFLIDYASLDHTGGCPILSSDKFTFSRTITPNIFGKQSATAVQTS